ncbi:MAG: S-layer homology domain-containing protein [Clostridiales bacterium]|jgi:hypothetical protein|nr:S-layer homology domain-containing protein [Clostridiales bacterium]
MKNLVSWIISGKRFNRYFNKEIDLRVRLFNVLVLASSIFCVVIGAVNLASGVGIVSGGRVSVVLCQLVFIGVSFFILFPYLFFNMGGYHGGISVFLVYGVGDNKFNPDAPVTRQDLAAILYRYTRFMHIDLPKKKERLPFADDANIASYAREALYAMQEAGIIYGKPGGLADPRGQATRAEAASMLHRFVEAIAE